MKTCYPFCFAVAMLAFMSGVTMAAPDVPPGATLSDDLKTITVPLAPGYAAKHPRLLFGTDDLAALKKKAQAQPALWKEVLNSSKRLGNTVPDADTITTGRIYWRIEGVESAALAYLLTGDKAHLERADRWMLAHCKEAVWGTGFRDNVDLQASWFLYHIAIAYDALYNDLPQADRAAIRDGLAAHAKAIYDSLDPEKNKSFTYDQNHGFIPACALAPAALALLDDVPAAADWLKRDYAYMQRARYVMGDDGWYYEGPGYWSYAFNWHVYYADLLAHATGSKLADLFSPPSFRENWRMLLYLGLPAAPGMFDIGDTGDWKDGHRQRAFAVSHGPMLYEMSAALHSGEMRTLADSLCTQPNSDYPAATFLWFDDSTPPTPLDKIKPYWHFADHDYVVWRSGWDKDATICLFRCGPPEGHGATAKLQAMKDWRINTGHVHADIGGFLMFAKGEYLASGTGYTAEKWTRDQNTILIDNIGQADDGDYHNTIRYPYDKLDQARIDNIYLTDQYGFASGQYGPVYPQAKVGTVSLRRSLLMTARWMLVVDDLSGDRDHKLTWICHSDNEFTMGKDSASFISKHDKASLVIFSLGAAANTMDDKMGPTTVAAGHSPGAGKPEQRGFQIARTQTTAAKTSRLIHLLVPLAANDKMPTVTITDATAPDVALTITWPDGKTEAVRMAGAGLAGKTDKDPVTIVNK